MPKLSVIIPVYNTDIKYFSHCLESIYNSSLKDLEVIIIDDGSNKNYDELKIKYPNFNFYKTNNQGTLHARLYGLTFAKGEYVSFIDSDDSISFDYLESMLKCSENNNADIVFNDWGFWTHNSKYICTNDSTINTNFLVKDDEVLLKYFASFGTEHSYYILWNKIFKRELLLKAKNEIEKLNLSSLVYAEDVLISFFAFCYATKIANTHCGYYLYRIHNNQQIYVNDKEKFLNQLESMSKVFSIMENHLKNINRFDEVKLNFFKWKDLIASNNYTVAKHSKFKDVKDKILNEYNINKISKIPISAQKPYYHHHLFPKNLNEIEENIKSLFYSNKELIVYSKKSSYSYKRIFAIIKTFKIPLKLTNRKKMSNYLMPKEKYSLKLKFLHNEFIYRISTILFPKGSKIRKFLKSKF